MCLVASDPLRGAAGITVSHSPSAAAAMPRPWAAAPKALGARASTADEEAAAPMEEGEGLRSREDKEEALCSRLNPRASRLRTESREISRA